MRYFCKILPNILEILAHLYEPSIVLSTGENTKKKASKSLLSENMHSQEETANKQGNQTSRIIYVKYYGKKGGRGRGGGRTEGRENRVIR